MVDVKVRYYDTSLTSEWEVYVHPIPMDNGTYSPGREVIVVW